MSDRGRGEACVMEGRGVCDGEEVKAIKGGRGVRELYEVQCFDS